MAKSDTVERGKVRPAAVAGRFYPRDPVELRNLINDMLAQVTPATGRESEGLVAAGGAGGTPARLSGPKALIVPHAASAYAQFLPARDQIRRVVVLGPSHYVAVSGFATSSAEAFATPLGLVPVDVEAVRQVRALPQVRELDEAHEYEHSIEVQLPFLQTVLRDFALVPLAVGDATPEEVGQVLDLLWDGPETRFIISSDLSHYCDFQTARRLDAATAKAIEALKPGGVGEERACGRIPIRGLLQAARRHGLRARAVDLRNSGDTAGPRDKVVGYGAFVFEPA
jgi:AmmeMemoRadiSam system protein B